MRDHGPGANVGSRPNLNGCYQGRVAAYESALADLCLVFLCAVVIAEDGPSADIGVGADFRIAQISQVPSLCACAEMRFFQFDKITDMGVFLNMVVGTKSREWSDGGSGVNSRILGDGIRRDLNPISNPAILQYGAG